MRADTRMIMFRVLLALLPGTAALAWFFGAGVLLNLLLACATALLTEAAVLRARGRSLASLLDGSALVAGALLALTLPPLLPFWMLVIGTAFAMLFGKHLYGGLGHNPFNPAMVGYAALIISFPLAMSTWPQAGVSLALADILNAKLWQSGPLANLQALANDGLSGATALDTIKFRGALTIDETWQASQGLGQFAGLGWEWINAGFLLGGIYLLGSRTIPHMAPLGMLFGLGACALVFYDSGSSESLGSPLFHLLGGGTMLGAFFIVTDPVSSPDSRAGLWLFGLGVGLLTFLIRSIGAYPDGIAFAVLLMNALVPLMDYVRLRRP
ncbi:MAG: RnfABCDGE type electron transport complex subunit D [Pseudomonadales bacterium]|nr:RnfABCDGE type electron transport complex subunit D [Pseudomonadales bacterium]